MLNTAQRRSGAKPEGAPSTGGPRGGRIISAQFGAEWPNVDVTPDWGLKDGTLAVSCLCGKTIERIPQDQIGLQAPACDHKPGRRKRP